MTKEQAIEAIYRLNLGKNIPISNDCCIVNIQDIETALSIIEKQERVIDLMAEKIYEEGIVWDNKEEVKQYFENKAKE